MDKTTTLQEILWVLYVIIFSSLFFIGPTTYPLEFSGHMLLKSNHFSMLGLLLYLVTYSIDMSGFLLYSVIYSIYMSGDTWI